MATGHGQWAERIPAARFKPGEKEKNIMLRNFGFRGLHVVLAGALAAFVAGCDVDVNDPGQLPDADVEVTPGEAPDMDVHGPDVDVQQKEETITVPDVDVKSEEKTITVPDVNVDVPEENENEPEAATENP